MSGRARGTRNFELDLKLAGGRLPQQAQDVRRTVVRVPLLRRCGQHHAATCSVGRVTSGRDQQPTRINGQPLVYDFSVGTNGPAVFSKEFLSKLRCVVPVAR